MTTEDRIEEAKREYLYVLRAAKRSGTIRGPAAFWAGFSQCLEIFYPGLAEQWEKEAKEENRTCGTG